MMELLESLPHDVSEFNRLGATLARMAEVYAERFADPDGRVRGLLRPGDVVRFAEISLDRAQALYLERERTIAAVRRALALSP